MISDYVVAARCFLPNRADLRVALLDTRALLGGWCHHKPWNAASRLQERGGGYTHWRCDQRRGHTGQHRFNNYTWDATGKVDYEPIINQPWPYKRSPSARDIHGPSWTQRIRNMREQRNLMAKIRARRIP